MQLSNIEDRNCRRLPSRAKYIVSSSYRKGIVDDSLCSDRQRRLNGKWIESNTAAFDAAIQNLLAKIPSAIQDFRTVIPVGYFGHRFSYQKEQKIPLPYLYLRGSDMNFFVWLNGKFLGTHDLSSAPAEFNISGIIAEGDNFLDILALEWDDGSNPQGQAGRKKAIAFPEAYLLIRPNQHIRDYGITTRVMEEDANVSIHFCFHDKRIPASIRLLDDLGEIAATAELDNDVHHTVFSQYAMFTVRNPRLWNPEKPYYYTLLVETADEVLTDQIALRDLRIEDDHIYLNGKPLAFRSTRTKDIIGRFSNGCLSFLMQVRSVRAIHKGYFG